jgi:hypothetical protein
MNNYVFRSEIYGELIQRVFAALAEPASWPVLMHCTAGKDRTGVAVALTIKNLGVPDELIVAEYMLSDGTRYPESVLEILQGYPRYWHLKMSRRHRNSIGGILLDRDGFRNAARPGSQP